MAMFKPEEMSNEDLVLISKLAQQTERYQEMVVYVDRLLTSQTQLTAAERNLCSSAYKNIVASRRAQLKVLEATRSKTKESDTILFQINKYIDDIEKEMNEYCFRIIKIIEEDIFVNKHQVKSVESKVFYLKMKADYYRYLCEYPPNSKAYESYLEITLKTYEDADALARSNLPQTNPVRLSLHLNMSVFLFEHKNEKERAIELANRAFQEAIANIDTVNEENYKDCTMILQLMRDNINLWTEGQ